MRVEFVTMLVYSSAEDPGVISDLYHEYWHMFLHSTKIHLTPTVDTVTSMRQRNQRRVKTDTVLTLVWFPDSANILTQISIPLSMYHDKCCEIKVKNSGRSGWDEEVQERILEIWKTRLSKDDWGKHPNQSRQHGARGAWKHFTSSENTGGLRAQCDRHESKGAAQGRPLWLQLHESTHVRKRQRTYC